MLVPDKLENSSGATRLRLPASQLTLQLVFLGEACSVLMSRRLSFVHAIDMIENVCVSFMAVREEFSFA